MIGLVIVSHSRLLSDGLKQVADAMSRENVPIISAGGMEDNDKTLGTDAIRVLESIQSLTDCDGILIFSDIGSAKLSAETAIDLLEQNIRAKVQICQAPLVEGVLAAAVQSASGASLDDVAREAEQSFTPPSASSITASNDQPLSPHSDDALVREYSISNPLGLHARPAALFVTTMSRFQSDVRIRNITKKSPYVNAKSINRIITLEIEQSDDVSVSADGKDASEALDAMDELAATGFGEGVPHAAQKSTTALRQPVNIRHVDAENNTRLKGIPIAAGYAVAEAQHHRAIPVNVECHHIENSSTEITRLDDAMAKARDELVTLTETSREKIGVYEAKIFEAQQAQLNDPEILECTHKAILENHINAEAAWQQTVQTFITEYEQLDNKVLRARGADLADVGARVLSILAGTDLAKPTMTHPIILCVSELRPSDIPILDMTWIVGICAEKGSKTSHAGILASGLGVPVVFSLGDGLSQISDGDKITIDGVTGSVDCAPDATAVAKAETNRANWFKHVAEADRVKFEPAITVDGHRCRVAANMRGLPEISEIRNSGAEEVGLFRTEFLYMNRTQPPTEDEQFEIYKQAVIGLEQRPLVIRTMDIGGDKPVPYMERDPEDNPNLGWRGLRFGLDNPDISRLQIRAILRAGVEGPVRIMFPMVSTLDEVKAARQQCNAEMSSLASNNIPYGKDIEIGIMIEVPAAAEMAEQLAPHVDFFSIGTNDLTQYIMAADRGNPKVADLFDPFHPAVLRCIHRTILAANNAGIWVGMCGAMAGDPLATPILIGMGLDEFSMNAAQVPAFKLGYRSLSLAACSAMAEKAMSLESAKEVKEHAKMFSNEMLLRGRQK